MNIGIALDISISIWIKLRQNQKICVAPYTSRKDRQQGKYRVGIKATIVFINKTLYEVTPNKIKNFAEFFLFICFKISHIVI